MSVCTSMYVCPDAHNLSHIHALKETGSLLLFACVLPCHLFSSSRSCTLSMHRIFTHTYAHTHSRLLKFLWKSNRLKHLWQRKCPLRLLRRRHRQRHLSVRLFVDLYVCSLFNTFPVLQIHTLQAVAVPAEELPAEAPPAEDAPPATPADEV